MRPERVGPRPLLLLGAVAVYLVPVLLVPAHFIQDDSYFYLQVARNLADGLGSTFHGLTPTNGYHPLWLGLLAGLFLLAGVGGAAALRLVFALQALLLAGAVVLFRRVALRLELRAWPAGAALLAGFFLSTSLYGSEAHLNVLLLAAGIAALLGAAHGPIRLRAWAGSGAILGLAVLARLDNVFVAGALLTAVALVPSGEPPRRRAAAVLAAGGAVTAVLAPYLVLNAATTGHLMPISGAIKSTFPAVTGRLESLGDLGMLTAAGGAVSLLLAALPGSAPARRGVLGGLGAGVLLHAAYVVLWTDHYTFWRWYYVAGVLNLAFLAAWGVETVAAWSARPAAAVTTLLVAAGLAYGWLKALDPVAIGPWTLPGRVNEYRWADEAGAWMRERLPAGSAVLVYDYPGSLAWHSGLSILPADGLINDFAWNDEILERGIGPWLCARGVGYYLGPMLDSTAELGPRGELVASGPEDGVRRITVRAPLHRRPAGEIAVRDGELVATVEEMVGEPQRADGVALWRMDPCRAAATAAGDPG